MVQGGEYTRFQFIHTSLGRRLQYFSLQDDFELCLQFVLHFYCTAG